MRDTLRKFAEWVGLIRRVDDEVARRLEAKAREDEERALRDPFRFASWEDFARYRRARGLSTPRRPRDPDKEPWIAISRGLW